jgi:ketosteroid isomerase-like protein
MAAITKGRCSVPHSNDVSTVEKLTSEWHAAAERGDFADHVSYFADDAVVLYGGPEMDPAELAVYLEVFQRYGLLGTEALQKQTTSVDGDLAHSWFTVQTILDNEGEPVRQWNLRRLWLMITAKTDATNSARRRIRTYLLILAPRRCQLEAEGRNA